MSEARDQISSYLLGELGPAEASAFERQLAEDPALRAEVDGLRSVVARLDELPEEAWAPPEPPPLQMPDDAAGEPRRTRRRRLLRLPTLTLRPAAAGGLAALLLAIGIAAGVLIDSGSGNAPASADLVLSRIDDGPAGAHGDVLVAGDAREATLELAGLDPTGPDNFYELWLLDEDGRMIALGSFPVGGDGKAEIELPLPVEPSRYRYFDVSLQEDNGDPAHSGVSVLRGPTSS